jgi:hypothetical protein
MGTCYSTDLLTDIPPLLSITIKGARVEALSTWPDKRNVCSFDIEPWFIGRARVLVRFDLLLAPQRCC